MGCVCVEKGGGCVWRSVGVSENREIWVVLFICVWRDWAVCASVCAWGKTGVCV